MLTIERDLLERTSKDLIETLLFCLPHASQGTFYTIGKPPDLTVERIYSGILDQGKKEVVWGMGGSGEFDFPGKTWPQYRDEPGRVPQPLAWCITFQKGRTVTNHQGIAAEKNPQGEIYHLEPLLVPKSILDLDMYPSDEYPKDHQNMAIWKESDQAVVGVVKLTFKSTEEQLTGGDIQIIKKLTDSLGNKLLSFQLRQDSVRTMQQVSKERLYACNILADSLRNVITKSGLIFSLIKMEVGYLRDQWENLLFTELQEKDQKRESIRQLNSLLLEMEFEDPILVQDLIKIQNRFLDLSLPPEKGENWISMQIESRWKQLLEAEPRNESASVVVLATIADLKRSLYFGLDPVHVGKYAHIPPEVKEEWIRLIYQNFERFNADTLNRIIRILEGKSIQINSRERSFRRLVQLKALAETMNQLEHNTNFLLQQVLNGGAEELTAEFIHRFESGMPQKIDQLSNDDPLPQLSRLNS